MDQISFAAPPYFDPAALRDELTSYWRECPDDAARLRQRVLLRLKALKKDTRDKARDLLYATGDGRACARALSIIQDEIIRLIFDFSVTHVYRAQNPSASEQMALVATGGYGRELMAPGSDVDLLFLFPYKQTAWGESVAESVLYFLWDLGYKVGHATRNVEQTLKAARDDMTIRTALLDARHIYGEVKLFQELRSRFMSSVVQGTQREFIAAKLAERENRLKRAGISRYRVEPNIKEGKGGLRDLNMLHWFAAYLSPGAPGAERTIFSASELALYQRCEEFLWTIRCHLHFLANKAEETLSFDMQPEMAARLKYKNRGGLLAVERFMKHYFLVAKDVGDLTRIVCSSLELRQLKAVPNLSDFVGAMPWSSRARLAATTDFRIDNSRLNVKNPDVFKKDPVNLIRLFVEAERNDVLLHPEAIRLVRSSLRLIDDAFRSNPEVNALFLELLTSRGAPEAMLRRLNEAGVLGRLIPEFGRVVGLAQFNMYHHYTIDEHLIRAIGILSNIEKGELGHELPLSTEIISDIQNRRALYLALLMHDVAKGMEGDHSVVGAEQIWQVARRLGLSDGEADTARWLVQHHLVMSQTAQSRDITNPKTVRDFADIVQSPERLKLLLLLTTADIRAVGPGIWNGWKGQLLRTLYYETEPLLGGVHYSPKRVPAREAMGKLREALGDWPVPEIEKFISRQDTTYWLKTPVEQQVEHAKLLRTFEAGTEPLAFSVESNAFLSQTKLNLVTRDHPKLLMLFAGACAAAAANIAAAQISTTKDGIALDTIVLQRALTHDEEELERGRKIARVISEVRQGKRSLESLNSTNQKPRARLEAFQVPTDVIFDNTASEEQTLIEVHALDRPGLLFDLARALADLGLSIFSAHIATFGEKAVDVFYVTDGKGEKLRGEAVKMQIRQALTDAVG